MATVTPQELAAVRARSPIGSKYDSPVNRESAYEILSRRTLEKESAQPQPTQAEAEEPSERGSFEDILWGTKRRQGLAETFAKQAARSVGSQFGRKIIRGVLVAVLLTQVVMNTGYP